MHGTRAGGASHSLQRVPRRVFPRPLTTLALLLSPLLPTSGSSQIRPVQIEGFVVTGTPVPRAAGTVASHVTVLEGDELRRRGVVRVADALSEVSGLVVTQSGSYGSLTSTYFRGAESDHVKILVDGVEMNQAGGGFDFAGLLVSDLERIEVVRGPASAFYGSDAMVGVIHVITRRGRGPLKVSGHARGGSFGSMDWGADVSAGVGSGGYSLSLSRMTSDGILEFNNGFRNTVLSGKVFTAAGGNTHGEVSGRYSDRTYHFPTDGSGNVVDRNSFTFGEEWTLKGEAGRTISEKLEVLATVKTYKWNGGSDDRSDGPADTLGYFGYTTRDSFRRLAGDLRGSVAVRSGTVLSAGVEMVHEDQRSVSESFSQFGPSQGDSRYERWNRGYYAHLLSEVGGWAGNLGARLDDNEQYGSFFTYQAGVSYRLPGLGTRLRGSVGRGMKEPAFLETSSTGFTVGNPDLEPERSFVWEVGVERGVGGRGLASVTWFRQSLQDLIQYTSSTPEPGLPNFFNLAEARTQGVEVVLEAALGSLTLSGGYTYLDSEVLNAGFDEGDGAVFVKGSRLIRRPENQGTLRAVYHFANSSLNWAVRWTGTRSDRDFSTWPPAPVELSSYTLLTMGGDLNLLSARSGRPGVTLQVRGENLLDKEYQEVFGFRAPGRAIFVGVQMTFGESGY